CDPPARPLRSFPRRLFRARAARFVPTAGPVRGPRSLGVRAAEFPKAKPSGGVARLGKRAGRIGVGTARSCGRRRKDRFIMKIAPPGSVFEKQEHAPSRPASPAENSRNSKITARVARLLGARSRSLGRAPSAIGVGDAAHAASAASRRQPAGAASAGRLGYLVTSFPRVSETFIINEIIELERQGFDLRIYSMVAATDRIRHRLVDEIHPPIRYLPSALPPSLG